MVHFNSLKLRSIAVEFCLLLVMIFRRFQKRAATLHHFLLMVLLVWKLVDVIASGLDMYIIREPCYFLCPGCSQREQCFCLLDGVTKTKLRP